MAINRKRGDRGYGLDNALQDLAPQPIIAKRAPTTRDVALPGTVWIDQSIGGGSSYTFIGGGPSNAVWSATAGTASSTFDTEIIANSGFDQTAGEFSVVSDGPDELAINLETTDPNGGITLDGSGVGNITLEAGAGTFAGTAITLNSRIGAATFTGVTTATTAAETFTITNSEVTATSTLIVTVSNVGAADAKMTLQQVKPAAGSFQVFTINNGAAALNGNVVISWILLG